MSSQQKDALYRIETKWMHYNRSRDVRYRESG